MWHVSGYEDARRVLSDPDTLVERMLSRLMQRATDMWPDKFTAWPIIFELMNLSNGTRHTVLRKSAAGLTSQIHSDLDEEMLRARLQAACAASEAEGVEVISTIVDPTLNSWLAEAFDLDVSDVFDLRKTAAVLLHTFGQGLAGTNPSVIESQSKALIASCSQTFGRPMEHWQDEDFAMITFIVPGLTAVTAALTNLLDYLASRPALQEKLRGSSEFRKPFLSEAERFVGGARFLHRTTGPDGVTLASCHLPGSQSVMVDIAAASRDPARSENPQDFDANRLPASHLNFGFGVHRCLGIKASRRVIPQFVNAMLDTASITPAPGKRHMTDLTMDYLVELPLHFSPLPEQI